MTETNDNKRKAFRRRTIFGGVLYEDNGRPVECAVSDISESGVKVKANIDLKVGTELDLKINKFNDIRRCSVAWIRDGAIGLSFLVPITPKDEEMAKLFKFSKPNRI